MIEYKIRKGSIDGKAMFMLECNSISVRDGLIKGIKEAIVRRELAMNEIKEHDQKQKEEGEETNEEKKE